MASAAMQQISNASSTEDRINACKEVVAIAEKDGLVSFEDGVFKTLKEFMTSNNAQEKEGAALLVTALCEKFGKGAAPFVHPLLADLLELAGDKKSNETRVAAADAGKAFAKVLPSFIVSSLIPELLKIATDAIKWQTKVTALEMLVVFVDTAPEQIHEKMVEVVPVLSALMWDSKKQVKDQATSAMKSCCAAIDNKDIQPFIATLISAINHPEEVTECIHALAATTFVQAVDAAALSITVPLLDRGFKERVVATKRKCAVITENMAKLVENPADVATFMPLLEPALARASEEVADPECRSRCAAAHQALKDIHTRGQEVTKKQPSPVEDIKESAKKLLAKNGAKTDGAGSDRVLQFVAQMIFNLEKSPSTPDFDDWKEDFLPLIQKTLIADEVKATAAVRALMDQSNADSEPQAVIEDDVNDDSEVLCNCKFSLAYGSKILLNNATLYLRRGHRYGVVAQKSAGKTTLLRAISNYQIDGFPTADQLKTVFVEHDIQGSQAKMNVLDFTLDTVGEEGLSREEVSSMLHSVGFTDQMKEMPVTSLSGGWKMKLALARAMLRKADILLLDEPTNHLDVLNVQWVVDYLTGEACKNVTSIIVSHDTKFLDNVATNIIHFNALKLDLLQGNLTQFVEKFPHAKSYYDLTASTLKFSFPEPAALDGVRSRGRPILTMDNVNFTYPGTDKQVLHNVSIRVSMASRVACVGANGAGKSTMIKLLTGELKPDTGAVWKHPNCKFAYVAQHAFHHIEQHLDKTPNEYIQWRYQGGEDKEALQKVTTKLTEEEEKKIKEPIMITYEDAEGKKIKEKRVVEKIISRRKQGKVLEYEVKWEKKPQDDNMWFPRERLEELGFKKLLDEVDRRKAAAEGMFLRTLTAANVEKHLAEVGLEAELATHNRIRSLSGGQKVKVVLGACTWAQPHLIILDEPTNYLDREALGALAGAINDFQGGVVLITHNKEFAEATTRETWVVAAGRCDIKGDPEWEKYAAEALELAAQEDMTDAAGNKVEVKKTPASVKPKDKKKMMKDLKKKIQDGDEMTDFEEACATEWGLFSG